MVWGSFVWPQPELFAFILQQNKPADVLMISFIKYETRVVKIFFLIDVSNMK